MSDKWTCPNCGGMWHNNFNEDARQISDIFNEVKMCSRCCQLKLAEARIAELEAELDMIRRAGTTDILEFIGIEEPPPDNERS